MSRIFLFACSLLVLSAATPSAQPGRADGPPAAQVLPMLYYGTRPAVQVRVNGQGPFLFLIDTGAGGAPARADAGLVRQLGLRPSGATETSDAGGAAASIDRVTLDSVELGAFRADRVEAYARDYNGTNYLPRIDGILGFAFFANVLLTLDFPRSQVRIAPGALPPADGRTILDYELVEGNPAIAVRIGERPYRILLDTGDLRAVDLPTQWLRSLPLAGFPRVVGTSSSVSGTIGLREVALAEPLFIGQYRFDNPRVTFADEFQEANLGSTVLRAFTVTIDQRNRRVRLIAARGRNPFR